MAKSEKGGKRRGQIKRRGDRNGLYKQVNVGNCQVSSEVKYGCRGAGSATLHGARLLVALVSAAEEMAGLEMLAQED